MTVINKFTLFLILRAYHRQIEKKRRNRINMMLEEISSLVPICQSIPHRLDKLSVLELAVQRVEMLTRKSDQTIYFHYNVVCKLASFDG